jgi:hypothetical protein
MIGVTPASGRFWIALGAGILALAASEAAFGQSAGKSIAWSPSREEAAIGSLEPASALAVRPAAAVEEIAPADPVPTTTPRPARLMPRGVGRMHTEYVDGPPVVEHHHPDHYPEAGPWDGCATCSGLGCGDCCGDCCGNWNSCGPVQPWCLLPPCPLANFQVLAGVQGFTGPLNRGGTSSFGFYEGFNHAIPMFGGCLGGQIGAQWTQSNHEGAYFSSEEREQIFFTAGLFRRVDCGLQGGLVFDYLHDEWDYDLDLGQLRGEIGWKCDPCNEFGFWFAAGGDNDRSSLALPDINNGQINLNNSNARVEVNDLYALFYRRQFACGGEGRLFAGWTGNEQGLFGGDAIVPLNPCWSLQAGFLVVEASNDEAFEGLGFIEETWNVSVGLVWTPFARPGACCPNLCRPLFNVANNGTFITRIPAGN